MPYLATVNTPGYLPWDDDPPVFETAREAWDYLAYQRMSAEDDAVCVECEDGPGCPWDAAHEYSETHETLAILGTGAHWDHPDYVVQLEDYSLASDGTGTVYGDTPGYHGDHDLGLAYSVTLVEDGDDDE